MVPNAVELAHTVEGAGPPVVLLHGLGSRGADWAPQMTALTAAGYRVVAVDLRGHGGSPRPAGAWTLPDFAADVAALVRRLGVAPAHVVGLSLGGMVAFQLAVDHPDTVQSAVIINSGPAFPGRTWRGRLLIWSRLLLLRSQGLPGLGKGIAARLFPLPHQAALARQFLEGFVQNDRASYAGTLRAIAGFDVAARLSEVRCPVLVVSGDRDYTPVAAKEAWARQLAYARLAVVRDSGHASPVDQPEAVNRLLQDFLAGLDSPQRAPDRSTRSAS